ncbi:uncharacterized protein [Dermacentor andersoni]|uniref:uncharacterized protein isoform X2 n=1 Tax=Dermacentor andersoni TaxID=34620 RepID=UPI0024177B7C|nr:uncharacterized protein LOC126533554 isoform X2 [Dermacentor andersoni]
MMSSDEEEEIAGILLATCLVAFQEQKRKAQRKKPRQRRWWVRPALQERDRMGHANVLLPHLRSRDLEYYRDYLRMPPRCFDTLLELLKPRIQKSDTNYRKAIPPEHRLALAVRFLASGETLRSSSFSFLSGRSTACMIVPEVCQAIWDVLGPVYVSRPSTPAEWLKVAREFEEKWDMPHCLGAIDGKHVNVECPANSGSRDRNYKNTFSKSLLAVSGANYSFLYVEIGHHGSESDGGIFSRSNLQAKIIEDSLGVPAPASLGRIGSIPYFFVGDEAFPLKTYMMRPYSRKGLHPVLSVSSSIATKQACSAESSTTTQFEELQQRRIFNYRLSRARRVVENSFGIMAQRWRILRRPFKAKEENIRRIVSACVVLHNFLLKESPESKATYCPPGTADTEDWQGNVTDGNWRAEGTDNGALVTLNGAGCHSARYFITEGKVPWQESHVKDCRW